jgi:cytidine deaminase
VTSGSILDADWESLIAAAKDVSRNAYCPYSNFRVGCAVLGERGIYVGCNIENASYGGTSCAERNAIFAAVAQGDRMIRRVAIYTPTEDPAAPCGPCRQVIHEFNPDAEILSACDGKRVLRTTLADLLPHAFGPANLKRDSK